MNINITSFGLPLESYSGCIDSNYPVPFLYFPQKKGICKLLHGTYSMSLLSGSAVSMLKLQIGSQLNIFSMVAKVARNSICYNHTLTEALTSNTQEGTLSFAMQVTSIVVPALQTLLSPLSLFSGFFEQHALINMEDSKIISDLDRDSSNEGDLRFHELKVRTAHSKTGCNLLFTAVDQSNVNLLLKLSKLNSTFWNPVDRNGQTPYMRALKMNNTKMVDLLSKIKEVQKSQIKA